MNNRSSTCPTIHTLPEVNLPILPKLQQLGLINPGDIRPIEVGETLCKLTAKCLCVAMRMKATHKPCQYGIACPFGDEKIAYSLRFMH